MLCLRFSAAACGEDSSWSSYQDESSRVFPWWDGERGSRNSLECVCGTEEGWDEVGGRGCESDPFSKSLLLFPSRLCFKNREAFKLLKSILSLSSAARRRPPPSPPHPTPRRSSSPRRSPQPFWSAAKIAGIPATKGPMMWAPVGSGGLVVVGGGTPP